MVFAIASYPVYLFTNFKSNSDRASFRFAQNIRNSLLDVSELQTHQRMECRFQTLAIDSNNFKRAPQVQTLARSKGNVAWPRTQISQELLISWPTSLWNSPLSLSTPSSHTGPAVLLGSINISDDKTLGKVIPLLSPMIRGQNQDFKISKRTDNWTRINRTALNRDKTNQEPPIQLHRCAPSRAHALRRSDN